MGVTKGTTFLDENLTDGEYEYYVVAHYEMGCVADSSNHVKIEIEVGIEEKGEGRKEKVVLYPNPTTGELTIEWTGGQVNEIEIYDVYGRKLEIPHCVWNDVIPSVAQRNEESRTINISHLNNGIYFVRVVFAGGSSVQKLVNQ